MVTTPTIIVDDHPQRPGSSRGCNVRVMVRADDFPVDASRILAVALFDDRSGTVIVAGQVLGGNEGIVGVGVRIATVSTTVDVTTGPMGSFGAKIVSGGDAIGDTITLTASDLVATYQVL